VYVFKKNPSKTTYTLHINCSAGRKTYMEAIYSDGYMDYRRTEAIILHL
jgi:rRNA maturation protein Nop10